MHCILQVGAQLVVLNLSQQTDSGDLLGGFQPVDPSQALLPLLEHFQVQCSVTYFCGYLMCQFSAKYDRRLRDSGHLDLMLEPFDEVMQCKGPV